MGAEARPQLPSPEATMRMLADLVGRRVVVTKTAKLVKTDVAAAAAYVDGAGEIRFVALANVAFLASAGASLALIPVGQVADAIKSKVVPPTILENSFEILNIASVLMNELDGAVHVKIASLDLTSKVPDRVRTAIDAAAASLDLEVEITGYPKGRLSFLVAKPRKV
jgi:hypothetical protein